MAEFLTIPGSGPGAGLMVCKGDFVQLAEGDWHEVYRFSDDEITAVDGLTIDPVSVTAVRLPSEMEGQHG